MFLRPECSKGGTASLPLWGWTGILQEIGRNWHLAGLNLGANALIQEITVGFTLF